MTWMTQGMAATGRALVRGGLAIVSAVLLVVHLALLVPGFGLGLLFLIPWPFVQMRRITGLARRVAGGVPAPYAAKPPPPEPEPDGRYRHARQLYTHPYWPRAVRYLEWVTGDRATWRDLGWMVANPLVGTVLGFGPVALVAAGGALAAVRPAALGWWAIPVGVVAAVLGFAVAPVAVRAHDRWTGTVLGPPPARIGAVKAWYGRRLYDLVRLAALGGLTVVSAFYAALSCMLLVAVFAVGLVVFLPPFAEHIRWLTNLRRRLARDWSGVTVDGPYRPQPQLPARRPDGLYEVNKHLYKSAQWARYNLRLDRAWRDPATWRDVAFLLLDPIVGGAIAGVPLGAVGVGFLGQVIPGVRLLVGDDNVEGPLVLVDRPWLALVLGVALLVFGFVVAPAALRLHGRWTSWLLRPTEKARLDLRVRQLTESRADANEAQAAELRRIERDLHDGAQARLVAVGITLGLIESLIEKDPAAARNLVAEARESSTKALAELRDLVRGVHPPVLQERGLGDAVRALALEVPVPTTVRVDLTGRVPAPIEAAVYFAVSEVLTNAAKHSGARRVEVRIEHDGRALYVRVEDDGRGGADPALGGGLRGLRHRLAVFDGTVRVQSPSGGPTVVTLEVPCASSSPRTCTS
ncbi:sensor domain-containing protein [Micromonospora sp. NPDC004551]|uniref:sensor histidine kinase n=1 Tax=Micromonospora sp. NPDC004551 TaxID=3154284 RepID=UPI00339F7D23